MKIQCSCGSKIAFEVTPEMAANPVQFVCPNCGLDSSAMVNQLIQQELGNTSAPINQASQSSPAPKPSVRIRIAASKPTTAAVDDGGAAPPEEEFCLKHPEKPVTHKCVVCGKGMCGECMAISGYVCSPLCRHKAETRGQVVPEYAFKKSVVEARRGRKAGLISGAISVAAAVLAVVWFWYAWFGSVPKVTYSLSFPTPATSGTIRLADQEHLVFLHGGELGRADMRKKQPAWTVLLVDKSQFAAQAEATLKQLTKARERQMESVEEPEEIKLPSPDALVDELAVEAIARLELHVVGRNIWVASDTALTRYDWDSGRVAEAFPITGGEGLRRHGDEMVLSELSADGTREITRRINLFTGKTTTDETEKILSPKLLALLTAAATNKPSRVRPPANRRPDSELDLQKIAAQTPGMSSAGKIALPALIAAARNQQRLNAELVGVSAAPPPRTELDRALEEWDSTTVVATANGPAQFTRTLLERKLVTREAMKATPAKPALGDSVSAGTSLTVANQMLNEMQREHGSTVTEDLSRYQVSVRRAASGTPIWTGEVVGPPVFHPLRTVDLITAGTTVIALDHENKKLWEAALNFPVPGENGEFDDSQNATHRGLGPCVERGDTVYVYDLGSLVAFDRTTGKSRWRLPSVGISGLWFDEKGMTYVNTTTAGPESIRYSRQIALGEQTLKQILKIDPATGKTLWRCAGANHVRYLAKNYLYAADRSTGGDENGGGLLSGGGAVRGGFVRVRRIAMGSGRIMWEHVQRRDALDIQFHENTILLLFADELQQLKFLAW